MIKPRQSPGERGVGRTSTADEAHAAASLAHLADGVADVLRLDGVDADPAATPRLLVEVPHGADRRSHYDALRSLLVGSLPADLHAFFHFNTDVGAWSYGRRAAERVVAALPEASALLVRCLVPRTFIDTNRLEGASDALASGGLTPGLAPYVRDPADVALLRDLHRRYVAVAEQAYDLVCDAGGVALSPHTYGPRSLGISRIDAAIVDTLRTACAPGVWETWPLRPEIDLLTRTGDGALRCPEWLEAALLEGFRDRGLDAVASQTYQLAAGTQLWRWLERHPGQVVSLEVRRDLLVECYAPFDELDVDPAAIERVAQPLADVLIAWLTRH